MNYARRQQYRRLSRAAATAMASAAAMVLALAVASVGAISAAAVLLVLALGFGLYARHWMLLAERSRVGARSEDEVRTVSPSRKPATAVGTRQPSDTLTAALGARARLAWS